MASRRLSLLQNRTRRWSNPLLVFLGGGGETVRTDAAVATTLSSCGVTNPMQHRPHKHRGSGRHFASSAVKVSEERRRARNIGISAFFYLCCSALLFLSLSDWSIDRSIDRSTDRFHFLRKRVSRRPSQMIRRCFDFCPTRSLFSARSRSGKILSPLARAPRVQSNFHYSF